MRPAPYIINMFGGVRSTSRILKIPKSTVMGWKTPKNKRGTGGKIPEKYWTIIIRKALQHKIDITIDDLQFGRFLNGKKRSST